MSDENGGKGKTGRPRKRLSAEDVQNCQRWAAEGYPEHAIAAKLGMSPDTLTRRKASHPALLRALETGAQVANGDVARSLFLLARGLPMIVDLRDEKGKVVKDEATGEPIKVVGYKRVPRLGAIVWWEKTRAGRRDPTYAAGGKTGEGNEAPDGREVIPLETLRAAVARAERLAAGHLHLENGRENGRKRA